MEEKKKKTKHTYKTGEDIDMLNENKYDDYFRKSKRNICDYHEDGA